MKPVWIYILAIAFGLAGCDVSDRKATAAIYKTNAESAKQCEARLKGLKRIPIAGTGEKLFLDAERLPMWAISRGFQPGDECGASQLGWAYEIFYWTGNEIIPQAVWLADGHSLLERPGPQDWMPIGALVFFGLPIDCKKTPEHCVGEQATFDVKGVIRLKNYPLDAWPVRDPKAQGQNLYGLSLRDWPMDNGRPRGLYSCLVQGKSEAEIESRLDTLSCGLDFSEFPLKAGSARISFSSKEFKRITPVLRALQQYLNNSIEERQK